MQCDNDGVADMRTPFNLAVYHEMFIGNQTGVALTYHLSENDMVTGDNPITNPEAFTNTLNLQTIYMKMTDVVTGCYSNHTFVIAVTPGIGHPQNLQECAEDGFATFNLAENDEPLLNGAGNGIISYYTSQQAAIDGTGPIGPLYQNQQALQSEQIWARLDKEEEGCTDFTSFTINPVPVPVFETPGNTPPDITLCDNDGTPDGSVVFDLTLNEDDFTGAQQNIAVSYYEDMDGLPAPLPLAVPQAYGNVMNPQLIHVVMRNTVTGCETYGTFTLHVPPGAGTPAPLEQCDDDGIAVFDLSQNDEAIANGNSGAQVTYYNSVTNAQLKQSPVGPLYENQAAYVPETIYARLDVPATGCTDYAQFTIKALTPPYFAVLDNHVPDMFTCDNDGIDDGLNIFNLIAADAQLAGPQQNVVFSYFEDDNGLPGNNITSPESYSNTTNPQLIHITITDTVTGCSTNGQFMLQVIPGAGTPADLYECSNNGIAVFNLSENNTAVANGNSSAVVSYFISEEDALSGLNPLGKTYQNTLAFQQETVWARSEVLGGSCYDITSFTVNIENPPQLYYPDSTPPSLTKCDDDAIDDESAAFNLTPFDLAFINGQENVLLTYHTSEADAESGNNPITTPEEYHNTTNPQTVYIRLASTLADCYATGYLTLNIDNAIPIGNPQDFWVCDTEETGFQLFDLFQNNNAVKDGATDREVTYHATQQDAMAKTNVLPRFYMNAIAYGPQQIWARLNRTDGCHGYAIAPFTIGVIPLPEIQFTLNVVDFTTNDNSIAIEMAGDTSEFEYSMDGQIYGSITTFTNLEPGLYTIYIRSKDGCSEESIEVPVLNYPRYFTPNGDGSHEVWNVNYIRYYPDARITIFDRYGKLITSYLGDERGWEGTYNGRNLPSTDYWFTLEFATGRKIQGHFSLVR